MTTEVSKRDAVVEAIASLENQHGQVTPERVLEAAIDPASPLHKCFEWNDEKAGHAYRIDQARSLIRRVKYQVTIKETTVSTVKYVHDVRAERDQGYVHVAKLDEEGLAEATVRAEIDRVISMIQRGKNIAASLNREDEFVAAIREAIA